MKKWIRISLACAIALGVEFTLWFLVPDLGGNLVLLVIGETIVFFVAFLVGGYVARENFLLPALIVIVLAWFLTLLTHIDFRLYPSVELADLLSRNLDKLAIWIIPTALGAISGMRLSTWSRARKEVRARGA